MGVVRAGEPISVGELVAVDGFDVVVVWVIEFGSEAWSCRLLLLERAIDLRSMSSRALFLLVSMIEIAGSVEGLMTDSFGGKLYAG